MQVAIFKIVLAGENFCLRSGATTRRYCFSATRFVEAVDSKAAQERSIEIVRRQLAEDVTNEPSDSPTLYIDSVEELASYAGREDAGQGFRWAPMDEKAGSKNRFRRHGVQRLFLR